VAEDALRIAEKRYKDAVAHCESLESAAKQQQQEEPKTQN
jgi:hypothetical protein